MPGRVVNIRKSLPFEGTLLGDYEHHSGYVFMSHDRRENAKLVNVLRASPWQFSGNFSDIYLM
jgi:hypothetical protein